MPKGRISKRTVDALTCPIGRDRTFLWDDAIAGFGVAAFRGGKKVYVAQYRKNGRSSRVAIGRHGRLTPDEARSEAKKLLGSAEQGVDIAELRRQARAVRTFAQTAADFLELHVRPKRKPRTYDGYQTMLKRHVVPAIGSKRISAVTRSDIVRLHATLSGTPGAANRVVEFISAVWNWAAKRDIVAFTDNPVKGLDRNPERKCERFLSSAELAHLGEALDRAERIGLSYDVDGSKATAKHAPKPENRFRRIDPYAIAAIRLLLLTGARLREILHLKWDYVDVERGIIHLPDSKTGRKPIYLSSAALAVLTSLPAQEGNPYVIVGERDNAPRSDLKKPWAAITKEAGLTGLRLHDLRHSFASIGAGASLGLPILGKLLGHSTPATTQRYAHLDADPMRRAVNTIGELINAAMQGSTTPPQRHPPEPL
jgi:integrase